MRLMICFFGVLLASSSADDNESVQARIARAMPAGPSEIAKSARIVDTDSNGKTVVLRQGNNGFTCMPGNPKVIGDPAMCADTASMQWAADFSSQTEADEHGTWNHLHGWPARRSAAIPIPTTKPVRRSPFPRTG